MAGIIGRDANPLAGEPVNAALREHVMTVNKWRYKELLRKFHEWAEIFNREFGLEIQTPAIQIARRSVVLLGSYCSDRNGFGVKHEIVMNARHLDRPFAEQLETLFHELLHLWQTLWGSPQRNRNNYHNVQFRLKAKIYGLVVDERGRHLGVARGRFTELLERYGVDTMTLVPPAGELPRREWGRSKMRKWSCGCTNVRCAVKLSAHCNKCGGKFVPSDPAW